VKDLAENRARIRDVAALAGVSTATVSNTLNHPEQVATATRDRVERAMAELNFVKNASARQLRVGRSLMVGAIVLDISNPFYTALIRGIEDRLAADDCTLLICSSDEDPEREARFMRLFAEQGVRGVLLTPSGDPAEPLSYLSRLGIPAVLLDAESDQVSSVSVDHVAGARQAVSHLLDQGHRRIAFMNGPPDLRQCRDRGQGAWEAVQGHGLDPAEVLVSQALASMSATAGQAGLARLLDRPGPKPTAVFCVNDVVAMGVIRELRSRHLALPQDVAVVGYDDVPFAEELVIPLTSVRQPMHDLGWSAVDLLLTEPDQPRHITFTPQLVVRASSRPFGPGGRSEAGA
jgi:LacI family transcriptional regulator